MSYTVSFIGVGNMGGALLTAACRSVAPENIFITDYYFDKANELSKSLRCTAVSTNTQAVEEGDFIFLCVKPQMLGDVLADISDALCGSKCLVSIAAGVQISTIRSHLKGEAKKLPIVRIMPNLAASVGKGMIAVASDGASSEQLEQLSEILSSAGLTDELPEPLFDQFTAVASCLPAYVFVMLDAAADGAVAAGLPRDKALRYAAQAILGAASMYLDSEEHPAKLKDAVCSPGGSTIAGLEKLENGGFRATIIDAIIAAYERNVELGR